MVRNILLLLAISLAALSCAPGTETPAIKEAAPPSSISTGTEKPSWQVEWEKTLAEAKKEGNVVVYTGGSIGPAQDTFRRTMKENYRLDAEITTGRGADTSAKIQTMRRAGLYLVDVYIGSAKRLLQTDKPTGALDPLEPALILPEVLDKQAWWDGSLKWVDNDRTILTHLTYVDPPILINTNLVRPEEMKSYRDLLNPKWKGRIVMDDPSMGGTTSATLFAIGEVLMGWDFVRQLAGQNPVIIRDRRLILEWIAQGKYPISLMTTGADAFIKAGAPMEEIIPREGGHLASASGSLALMNKAPHPAAARVFINWLLSREGQTLFSQAVSIPSLRVDTPKDMFDTRQVLKPGVKYVAADTEELIMKRIKFEEVTAKEIFGHLLK